MSDPSLIAWWLLVVALIITIIARRKNGIDEWDLGLDVPLLIFFIFTNILFFLMLLLGVDLLIRVLNAL